MPVIDGYQGTELLSAWRRQKILPIGRLACRKRDSPWEDRKLHAAGAMQGMKRNDV